MIAEHAIVAMNNDDRSDDGLHAGDVGAVVHVYDEGKAYEVEFVEGNGTTTVASLTLEAEDVWPIESGELLHIRRRA